MKNMMGSLLEELLATWNHTHSSILQAKAKIVESYMVITHKDVMAIWKILAMGLDSTGDGGSGSVSMAPSGSMNVVSYPTMPPASMVPFLISTTITQLSKWVREVDAYVGKTTPIRGNFNLKWAFKK